MGLFSILDTILYLFIGQGIYGVFGLVWFIYGVMSLIVCPLSIMGVISEETKQDILIISPAIVGVLILSAGIINHDAILYAFGFGVAFTSGVVGVVLADIFEQKRKLEKMKEKVNENESY